MTHTDPWSGRHPIAFAIVSVLGWLVLVIVFTGIASALLKTSFGDPAGMTVGSLAVAVCIGLLLKRLGWMKGAGIAVMGRASAWALALGGLVYFGWACLYSFYGAAGCSLQPCPAPTDLLSVSLLPFAVALSEEVLFRGLVLHALVRAWGRTRRGAIRSVALTSMLFAALHLTQVPAMGVSPGSVILLTIETFLISLWLGTLVLVGGSVWPAVLHHFAVNALISLQGLTLPIVEPETLAYTRALWFSVPLAFVAITFLARFDDSGAPTPQPATQPSDSP